jgi:hypothetical protein
MTRFRCCSVINSVAFLGYRCLPATARELASLHFGLFLAVFAFTVTNVVERIGRQTQSLANTYLLMIWLEGGLTSSSPLSPFSFLTAWSPTASACSLLRGTCRPS